MGRVSARGINEKVIESFKEIVINKHDKLHTAYGLEIEKAMKIYLTLNGEGSYRDDPDVQEMFSGLAHFDQHSHTSEPSKDIKKPRNNNNIDMFAEAFIQRYGNRDQVSRAEVTHFATIVDGVADPRSVSNRIHYMVSNGVLEPFAPNVFNVKKEGNLGFP